MRVMIVVTHLLGTGHLARALTLGRAFAHSGHRVTVVSGGLPVPHFDPSGLCLIHCLGTPILLLLFPMAHGLGGLHSSIHWIAAVLLIPMAVYAATATAYWRFMQFNVLQPNKGLEKHYQGMQRIADQLYFLDPDLLR